MEEDDEDEEEDTTRRRTKRISQNKEEAEEPEPQVSGPPQHPAELFFMTIKVLLLIVVRAHGLLPGPLMWKWVILPLPRPLIVRVGV